MDLQDLFNAYVRSTEGELNLGGFINHCDSHGVCLESPGAYDEPITGPKITNPKSFYDLARDCSVGAIEEHGYDSFYLA